MLGRGVGRGFGGALESSTGRMGRIQGRVSISLCSGVASEMKEHQVAQGGCWPREHLGQEEGRAQEHLEGGEPASQTPSIA